MTDLEKVVGLYHTVATAFAILVIKSLCGSDTFVNQFIASMFVSYNFVVMYMLSRVIKVKTTALLVPRYLVATQSEPRLNVLDEVSALVCALITGYIMAYVFAGVTDIGVFFWGFFYGISVKYIVREILKHLTFLNLEKPRYILMISAGIGALLGLLGYVMIILARELLPTL